MRWNIILILVLLPAVAIAQLPDFYHTYDEAIDSLWELEALRPDIIDVFLIGQSTQDSIPIYAVKISDSVQYNRDKPRLIFVGVIHAEENIGLELVLDVVTEFVNQPGSQWSIYTALSEIYIIPAMNPEGLNVVTDNLDLTFRKNKRDNVGDGLFRYVPGVGSDSSGVDPNRNFGLNWIHGDTLWQGGHFELYDYYRGPAPFSEGMTQAVRDLAEEKHFSLGIVYHQSRSTNFSEKVIYSWNWEGNKYSPDFDAIEDIGVTLAAQIHNLGISGTYEPNAASGRYGNSHDWFYAAMGCYQYTVETSSIQPPVYEDLMFIINENKNGLYYLVERAIGYTFSSNWDELGQLTGRVTDAVTGAPLEAEVRLLNRIVGDTLVARTSGMLAPRMTIPEFGRYRFYLIHGGYNIEVSKPGYAAHTQMVTVGSSLPFTLNIELEPLPTHQVQGVLTDIFTGEAVEAELIFSGNMTDTVQAVGGVFSVDLPESDYTLRIDAGGYVSRFEEFSLTAPLTLDRLLSPGNEIFSDDFESGGGEWTFGGEVEWGIDYGESHSGGASIADSPGAVYANNSYGYIEKTIDLTDYATAHLSFWHKYYLEPEYDFGCVEVSIDAGVNWEELGIFDLQDIDWREERFDLTPCCGNQMTLRFTIETDGNIIEPGWNIDDVSIVGSDSLYNSAAENIVPAGFYITNPHPNPFNSSTIIRFNLDKPAFTKITIHNVLGREVRILMSQKMPEGPCTVKWNAEGIPSGIYFARFESGEHLRVAKVLLLK